MRTIEVLISCLYIMTRLPQASPVQAFNKETITPLSDASVCSPSYGALKKTRRRKRTLRSQKPWETSSSLWLELSTWTAGCLWRPCGKFTTQWWGPWSVRKTRAAFLHHCCWRFHSSLHVKFLLQRSSLLTCRDLRSENCWKWSQKPPSSGVTASYLSADLGL